jgi:tripartite-type tricarboxylate transporter receptor subunit TctC
MKLFTASAKISVAWVLLLISGAVTAQQDYPNRPIHLISPFAPGGGNDIMARLVAHKLTERWGQQVVVDNRPGGNTVIGTEALVRSAPDGYTLLLAGSAHATTPLLVHTPYDPIRDFSPVATLGASELILVANAALPAADLRELLALARAQPGRLNFASSGNGGTPHLAGELMNMMAGIRMQHVPYKGIGPAVIDLIGGRAQLAFSPAINFMQHIKSGKLKAIAVSGEKRLPALREVPTFSEAGLPGFNATNWYGVLAPSGTPRAVIMRLSDEIGSIVLLPDISAKLVSQGTEPFVSTPEKFAALIKSDMVKYAKVIKAANIKLEE